ncbi:uncharacterized protein LOC118747488 [Rhagoletis pomonella]|uniref:uncharacterized protein LOC118747488 n=1 Tax=Rhagoletis pomonella TaxID=28610 RepID=UPI00177D08DA|nr:uncharacterized protein LOC118747488 [Rhagoletis pomonella]
MDNYTNENNTVTKLKVDLRKKFTELRAALHVREKLLLRQLEVVASTKQRLTECGSENSSITRPKSDEENCIQIFFENEDELLGSIRSFGRFQLGSMVLALKQEDYITPNCDHEIMYKNIQSDVNQYDELPQQVYDHLVVDFSKDKSLIEHNTKYINDSIVNITLAEAKDLIRNARIKNEVPLPPLNLEELDDELESSIVEAVSNLSRDSNINISEGFRPNSSDAREKRTKLCRSKQEITINNCSGTINLRNISNVTINCGHDKCELGGNLKTYINLNDSKNGTIVPYIVDSLSEHSTPSSVDSVSNQSSNSNSRSQSKKQKHRKLSVDGNINYDKEVDEPLRNASMHLTLPQANNDAESSSAGDTDSKTFSCDFYNRLLNEIKRNLEEQKPHRNVARFQKFTPELEISNQTDHNSAYLESTLKRKPHLVLKNFENLNIVLKNDGPNEPIRPEHVDHWLSEIIKDTDLEPMQNTDILEHSKIND